MKDKIISFNGLRFLAFFFIILHHTMKMNFKIFYTTHLTVEIFLIFIRQFIDKII